MHYRARVATLGVGLCAVTAVTSACGTGTATTAGVPPRFASSSSAPAPDPTTTTPARHTPPLNHCAANHAVQAVLVSLRVQHLWLCARLRQVYDTPITSGMAGPNTATPTGQYAIQGLVRDTTLSLNTGVTYPVKYWIPFDAPLFGFHDSSWQDFPYGSPRYRTSGSHGCIHMPLRAIAFLYRWAHIGTAVDIRA